MHNINKKWLLGCILLTLCQSIISSEPSKYSKSVNVKPKKIMLASFICDHNSCGKAFTLKSNLTQHERTHTGEKPHVCSTCGKAFAQKSHLTQHELIHTGEKPHVCSTCSKAFTLKVHLNHHKLTHTGERPHVCSTCGATFARKEYLTKHELTHTGERSHVCNTCGSAFILKSSLSRHERTHTKIKIKVTAPIINPDFYDFDEGIDEGFVYDDVEDKSLELAKETYSSTEESSFDEPLNTRSSRVKKRGRS